MLGGIAIIMAFMALFSGMMYFQQPGMVFFPEKQVLQTPMDWGFEYENVTLDTSDKLQLHGWFIPNDKSNKYLLLFHGNAGNISHRADTVSIFHQLGLNVFIFDYRGYGNSQGKPTEKGLYKDAKAAWQYLTKTRGIDKANIIVFGRSLGGVVAAHLASRVQPVGLILESVFSSAGEMAREIMPVMSLLVYMRFDFNAAEYVKSVKSPVLVLHSPDDEIIPFSLGEKVYAAANNPKTFVHLKGDHNSGFLLSQPNYEKALVKFINGIPDSDVKNVAPIPK